LLEGFSKCTENLNKGSETSLDPVARVPVMRAIEPRRNVSEYACGLRVLCIHVRINNKCVVNEYDISSVVTFYFTENKAVLYPSQL
jgi:hypothetical protein